ncbi:MAG TPA: hypothetical protein VFH73_10795 [Polyangia bacterium]|nr:hypothetical protein [Polyangia bacterium]
MEETSFDPRRRRLCPDGACVGLIGENARCKVCGLPAGGIPPTESADVAPLQPTTAGDDVADDDSDIGTDGDNQVAAAGAEAGGFNPNRRLCDDGACVGVVGPDGLCNVCGRPSAVTGVRG